MVLDETFDAVVARPLARPLARFFRRRGWSADQVTLLAAACGVGSGVALAFSGLWPLVGAALLVTMVILDCVDGEVARLGGGSNKPWRGRMIDGYADLATLLAVHVGMAVHLYGVTLPGSYQVGLIDVLLLTVLGMAGLTFCSSIVDDVKQRLKPGSVDYDLERFEAQVDGPLERFLFASYKSYVRNNERMCGDGHPGGYALYRQIRHTGPTTHLVAIAVAGCCVGWTPVAYTIYLLLSIIAGPLFLWFSLTRARRGLLHAERQA
jgi:hypothetical protein